MGFVIVRGGKIRLVGRDQRQSLAIGEIDQTGFGAAFLLDAVALQLDVEPVAEQACQPVAAQRRKRCLIGMDRQRDRPLRPSGQGDQVLGVAFQPFELDVRGLMNRGLQERPRVQPHQAAIAAFARRQQHDPGRSRGERIARVRVLVAEIDREFAADDGLDAVAGDLVGKFQRPEHVVGIGQRQRRLAVRLGEFRQLLDLDRPLQQRIGRVDVEMDKSGMGHGRRRLLHGLERSSGLRKRKPARRPTRPSMVRPRAAACPRRTLQRRARHPRFPVAFLPGHTPADHDFRAGESVAPRPRSSRRTAQSTPAPQPLPRISSTYPPPHMGTYEEHCSFFVLGVKGR